MRTLVRTTFQSVVHHDLAVVVLTCAMSAFAVGEGASRAPRKIMQQTTCRMLCHVLLYELNSSYIISALSHSMETLGSSEALCCSVKCCMDTLVSNFIVRHLKNSHCKYLVSDFLDLRINVSKTKSKYVVECCRSMVVQSCYLLLSGPETMISKTSFHPFSIPTYSWAWGHCGLLESLSAGIWLKAGHTAVTLDKFITGPQTDKQPFTLT